MFVCTPLLFVSAALAEDGMFFGGDPALQPHHNSLGRLCFIIAVLFMLAVGRRLLKRDGVVTKAVGYGLNKHGVARARVLRFGLNSVLSSAFLLALVGVYITAYLMIQNLLRTAVLTVILALIAALVRQWRLAQEDGLTERSMEAKERTREADEQMERLRHFGLTLVWLIGALVIWSAALPALSLLKNVELLPEFRVARDRGPAPAATLPAAHEPLKLENEVAPAPAPASAGAQPAQSAQPRDQLLLSDLLLAIFVGIMANMLVKNIPGLLHFTAFRRLRLDEGGQYAVTTITRYFVIIAGLLAVSGILGLNWSKVHWLAAALTFGIGFGLQEIFANFASGLILLLDRSIRVGDAVTVGTLSGVVARIQMRSTTVTLWDHSDMVVPNKEFVTTKLVNWTLSHRETRVDLKVGVDYGSDVEQVREVLMRLAEEHPAVLKDPAPQVLLTEFGQSAILFELRVFGLYSYGRPVLLDELHRAVMREFRRLGIVIAFPQLDVRLNSIVVAQKA
jgi:potassium efflux system protein